MKAKSIKGKTPSEIQKVLDESIGDGHLPDGQSFKPTLAIIILSKMEDAEDLRSIFGTRGIAIFGTTSPQKFTEQGISEDDIVVMLMDIQPEKNTRMEQKLKTILDFIQQSENLTADIKDTLSKTIKDVYKELAIITFKLDRTEKVKRTTAILLEETIEELEHKRKAVEAQNRELEIEAALEKVRSASLAMQNSGQIREIVKVVFEKLKELKFAIDGGVFVGTIPKNSEYLNFWIGDDHAEYPGSFKLPYYDAPTIADVWNTQKSGAEFFSKTYSFKEKNIWFEYAFNNTDLKNALPKDFKKWILEQEYLTQSFAMQKNSMIGVHFHHAKTLTENEIDILIRFSRVFEQSYVRFLDLQKAEAQTREAQIEAALERIRSRALAMHNSAEVGDVSDLLFSELEKMDINPTGFSIMVFDREHDKYELWRAKEVAHQGVYETFSIKAMYDKLNQYIPGFTEELESKWNSGSPYFIAELSGTKRISFLEANREMGNYTDDQFENVLRIYPDPVFWQLIFFKHGWLGLIQNQQLPENDLLVIRRFADVFEFAYTRFLDLQKAEAHALQAKEDLIAINAARQRAEEALAELQVTQKQLIQSEKMASLGELTAGIAHEIQNPLNFVNNFSEVSNELIDEMNDELDKGDIDEAKAIASDIKQNLEKINHHGKRADAIVKGMLQHSRTSSGVKEPTDINALADEYLRLAYHGLRAKDKSFNADFIPIAIGTDLDPTLPKINVIPQDIGRVLLNLINNAFYAVQVHAETRHALSLQQPTPQPDYSPTVTVSTKLIIPPSGGKGAFVLISVRDNGPGIPSSIVDKIFQPFFTTKPTGKGTGLGLSLSYDIVKAHGGELKVETKEGEGSEFILTLPV